uniref:BLUF domain-containing protein n=1 Tax=Oryzias latipes TaxID=8090 RepID=A0A3P9JPY2_ORYLA
MAASQKVNTSFNNYLEEEEEDSFNMLDVVSRQLREKIVLKQLIVVARIKQDLDEKKDLGAHYENIIFQLSKQHKWDHITGILLIYPFYLLHIIEAPNDILISILKDLKVEQQQPERALLEAKIVFVTQKLQSRLFQQWSYKVLKVSQAAGDAAQEKLHCDKPTEILVCDVLSTLQKLHAQLELQKKVLPGSVIDKNPQLIVSQQVLEKLMGREELLDPGSYLLMYNSPLNISIEFGETMSGSFLFTI